MNKERASYVLVGLIFWVPLVVHRRKLEPRLNILGKKYNRHCLTGVSEGSEQMC